jgi:hypothetical protein
MPLINIGTPSNTPTGDTLYDAFSKINTNALQVTSDIALKVNISDVINNLSSTEIAKPLSANQGKVLNDNKVNVSDVINTLVSTETAKPLSAAQGKVLQDGKVNISDVKNNLTSTDANKPVSVRQAKFLNERIKIVNGVNLLNILDFVDNNVLRENNFLEAGYVEYKTSKPIKINPSTDYYLSNYWGYGTYDIDMNQITYVTPYVETDSIISTGAAVYIRVTWKKVYSPIQLNIGATALAYADFVPAFYGKNEFDEEIFFNPIESKLTDVIDAQFIKTDGVNLYNKNGVINDVILRENNTVEAGFVEWTATPLIKIKPNTQYFIDTYQVYALYDIALNQLTFVAPYANTSSAFTTPANAVYIRISQRKIYIDQTQLKLGATETAYVPFNNTEYNKETNNIEIFFNPTPEKVYSLTDTSSLVGKKWLALGDSITFRDEYTGYVKKALRLDSFTNKGVAGRRVGQMIYEKDVDGLGTATIISPATLNAHDIISFCGYANNYGQSTVIGSITDATGGTTFYSEVKTVIEYLCTNAPDKLIICIGALQLKGYFAGDFGTVNGVGKTIFDYNEAMRLTCESYGIPFVDLYRNGGVNKYNADLFYDSPDYIHPNNTQGMQKMGRLIASKFRQLSEKIA